MKKKNIIILLLSIVLLFALSTSFILDHKSSAKKDDTEDTLEEESVVKETISFVLDGNTYDVVEGTTWVEWISDGEGSDLCFVDDSNNIRNKDTVKYILYVSGRNPGSAILHYEEIVADYVYETAK